MNRCPGTREHAVCAVKLVVAGKHHYQVGIIVKRLRGHVEGRETGDSRCTKVDDLHFAARPCVLQHFLEKHSQQLGRPARRITTPAIDLMMTYHWPGNVRELENVIQRALLLSEDGVIRAHHLPPSLQSASSTGTELRGSFDTLVAAYERELIVEALKTTRGNKARAARLLGTTPRILSYQAGKLGINAKAFRT